MSSCFGFLRRLPLLTLCVTNKPSLDARHERIREMPPANIATAADYADAMMIARRAKNTLFMLLALMLIIQIATFFVARMTNYILPDTNRSLAESLPPATAPATTTQPAESHNRITPSVLRYLTALIDFLGI